MNLDLGTVLVSAVVGALSTFVTMWRTSIVLETRMEQITETLKKFTSVVERLSSTVDGMNHVHDNLEELFNRMREAERDIAVLKAKT